MPVVDVSCPSCGAKFKAPDDAVGKKARCKKCGSKFRVPGVPAIPSADQPDEAEVMMAEAVDEVATPAPAPAPTPARPPKPAITPAPAAKAATPVPPRPAPPAAAPAPAKPAGKPEPLPLEPLPIEPVPAAASEAPTKSKTRDKAEDDAPPRARKKEREDEEPPRKKRKRDEPEKPAGAPAKEEPTGEEPYNPFADFDPGPGEVVAPAPLWEDEEPKAAKKRKKGDDEEAEEPPKPRYRRPQEKGGLGVTVLVTTVIGLFALGLGITAVVVFIRQNRPEPEQVKEEKKEEPPAPAADGPAGQPGDAAAAKEPEPKPKGKESEPKAKEPEMAPGMTRPPANLARPRALTVAALPDKTRPADKAGKETVLEAALASVKRVFPPADPKTGDTAVLVQTAPGADGTGEKLALDTYGPAGNRVAPERIEYDGDGLANPIADFTVAKDGKTFFLAATGGKLHVWAVTDRQKLADGVSPYAEKPEHAKSGLAAAFFTADPNRVVLVSTAGAVLLYDLKAKKPVKDFVPPNGAPGRVALGAAAAKAEGGNSVAVAVGGVLYQVQADASLGVVQQHDLGGDVYRSLGLAVVGTPGRIVYAFEALADGKKERLVLGLTGGKPVAYRLPAAAGEPSGALWAGDFAGVATDRGVLLFDDHEKNFLPMLFAQPPGGAGHYFGDEKSLWYVTPHAKEEGKSVLAALPMPPEAFESYTKKAAAGQPVPAATLDAKGLSK